MDAYIYRAALYCANCAEQATLDRSGMTPEDERLGEPFEDDSDHYYQGPYADGGGEADMPQHCDSCLVFLENPLTDDGVRKLRDWIDVDRAVRWYDPGSHTPGLEECIRFYADDLAYRAI